jgi:hypothetical protein
MRVTADTEIAAKEERSSCIRTSPGYLGTVTARIETVATKEDVESMKVRY